MTAFQKTIKYLAMALAAFLAVTIVGGALSAVGLIQGLFENDSVMEDTIGYPITTPITDLQLDVQAAELTIREGDTFSVESNLKYLTVSEENGTLTVKESGKFGATYTGAQVILSIPYGTEFAVASVQIGAGSISADVLTAKTLDLQLGAGEAVLQSLTVTEKATIDGGAGEITVVKGSIRGLDLHMGVGELHLTAQLLGESTFDLSLGTSEIVLDGGKESYTLNVKKGMGTITVDGDEVSSVVDMGEGENAVSVSGGIGEIRITFA